MLCTSIDMLPLKLEDIILKFLVFNIHIVKCITILVQTLISLLVTLRIPISLNSRPVDRWHEKTFSLMLLVY
jgi:hypothetical protein